MPARKEYGPPTRSSQRVASRASSVAADEPVNNAPSTVLRPAKSSEPSKTTIPKTRSSKTKLPKKAFDVAYIFDRLTRFGEFHLIDGLTPRQHVALLKASTAKQEEFRVRTEELQAENQELAALNERLLQERDAAKEEARKRHVRDIFLRDEAQKAEIQRAAQLMAQEMIAAQKVKAAAIAEANTSKTRTPQSSSEVSTAASTETSPSFSLLSSPAVASTPKAATNPAPPRSLLRRVLSGIASPFASRSTSASTGASISKGTSSATETSSPESPLGQLPATRKRPAEHMEPAKEVLAQQTPVRAPTAPGTPKVPASLSTITEVTEPSSESTATAMDATPCRPRPITKVRAARQSLAKTPNRGWTTKNTPRQPNADLRLERLQQPRMDSLEPQGTSKADEVVEASAPRPTKKVKVDHLLWIPHNRPGDSESTFRAPDIDSDDEMEVDIDVPLRPNIFGQSQAQIDRDQAEVQAKERAEKERQLKESQVVKPTAGSNKGAPETSQASVAQMPTAAEVSASETRDWQLEEAHLRQEIHDVQQWLKSCEPRHVDGLKERLERATQAKMTLERERSQQKAPLASASPEHADATELPTYEFPSGIFQESEEMDPEEAKYLAAEFHYGYLHWLRTGQCLPLY